MTINILFFGELREQLNRSEQTMDLPVASATVQDLITELIALGEPWAQAFSSQFPIQVAVNQEMTDLNCVIPENAEVAFFRPVTGG